MKKDQIIYKYRIYLRYLSGLLLVIGMTVSYLYYGTEPWETIGGFLCGFGLASFIVFLSLKQP
jgi:F0F1-type ATP synthase assembly protein I